MATYNGTKYLSQQLDSIINQTITPYEIVIIDDCSSDGTLVTLQIYQNKYNFIKIYQNDHNLGSGKSFFSGLQYCSGDYIAFADQDDIWLPKKLEVLLKNVKGNLLIFSGDSLIDANSNVIYSQNLDKSYYANLSFLDYLMQNKVRGCCSMISRKLLDYGLPEYFYIHDHYFALLASSINKIKYIPDQLVMYRQHSNNAIGTKKYSYDKFIQHSKLVADSYNSLLQVKVFKSEIHAIELMRDYRLAIATGKFLGHDSLCKLMSYHKGVKLTVYYLLIGGLFGRNISEKLYNLIHKL